jgi:hypothetical protein
VALPTIRRVTDYDDPGWAPALRQLAPAIFFPWLRLSKAYRQKEKAGLGNQLLAARAIFVGISIAPFLFLFVLSLSATNPHRWSSPGVWGWAALGFGVASLLTTAARTHRPINGSSPAALRGSWNGALFIGVGLASQSEFAALILTFVSHRLWVFVIGVLFTGLGFLLVAPSRRNIERRQTQLEASGVPLSLGRVLTSAPQEPFG